MNKTWRVNLLLLAVLCAGGGGLWWSDRQEQLQKEEEKAGRRMGLLSQESIQRIRFQDGKGGETVLERQEGNWKITAPVAVRTDQAVVKKLLEMLDHPYERKAADAPGDLKAYGLGQGVPALILEGPDGKRQTLQAGADAPVGATRYLLLDEKGPVVLAPRSELMALPKEADLFRDKRLFSGLSAQETVQVRLTRGQTRLELARDEQNTWRIQAPIADLAEAARVDSWLEMVATTTGSGFMKASPPATPDWVLTFTTRDKKEETVTIWRQTNEVLAQRPGEPDAMRLYSFIGKELDKQAEELADLHPLSAASSVTHLELRTKTGPLSADKKDGKWEKGAWGTLEEILTAKARSAVPPDTRGEPDFTVVAGEGEKAMVFPFWKEDKGLLLAPPGRPVRLRLTPLQGETLNEALKELMPPAESAEKKG